jgi:hypothetical protein
MRKFSIKINWENAIIISFFEILLNEKDWMAKKFIFTNKVFLLFVYFLIRKIGLKKRLEIFKKKYYFQKTKKSLKFIWF